MKSIEYKPTRHMSAAFGAILKNVNLKLPLTRRYYGDLSHKGRGKGLNIFTNFYETGPTASANFHSKSCTLGNQKVFPS